MKTYLISYDLIRPETSPEYSRLFAVIKSYLMWAKPLRSVWLVKTNKDKGEIMRNIRFVTDANDKFLIIEVTNDWISYNLPNTVVSWMKGGL